MFWVVREPAAANRAGPGREVRVPMGVAAADRDPVVPVPAADQVQGVADQVRAAVAAAVPADRVRVDQGRVALVLGVPVPVAGVPAGTFSKRLVQISIGEC